MLLAALTAAATLTVPSLGSATVQLRPSATRMATLSRRPWTPSLKSATLKNHPFAGLPFATNKGTLSSPVAVSAVADSTEESAQLQIARNQANEAAKTAKSWVDATRAAYAGRWALFPPCALGAIRGIQTGYPNLWFIIPIPVAWAIAYAMGKYADTRVERSVRAQRNVKKLQGTQAAPTQASTPTSAPTPETFIEIPPDNTSNPYVDLICLLVSSGVTLLVRRIGRGLSTIDRAPLLA